ncbi:MULTISPECIES: vWA domain-containing protein [Cetobacterium]|uniref:vWA domain-containing protein n=2 Tax=Fusobacteriaceae TaxID=203492 RepID=UPI001F06FCB2|nr:MULTISPECIES: VWA domain-containing protein [Cetobacterium]MCQ9627060.1 VWA domain-containing protein [Cetobacterium somerae]MCX3066713.1 VWA domain-containing protein [Cetobacterium somerae]UPO98649.1 VWA domain-containing protein [Cetobacterium somerae]
MYNFKIPYILILIPIVTYLFFRKRSQGAIKVPGIQIIKKYSKGSKKHLLGRVFMYLSTVFMILALARPQLTTEGKVVKKDGIDIAIALDLSKSMEARDFNPNRLEKSKELLNEFVDKRPNDRLSLVVFGGEAYTKVPLTFDHSVLKNMISNITTDDITSNNRTAIGMGLGVALNRLKDSNSKSKIIILMTDGENNSGEMSPIGAAEVAKELGIKVYTIGIGAKEIAVPGFFGTSYIENKELDENLLNLIAEKTNGKYFRASDSKEFQNIFNEINNLEKSKIDSRSIYNITEYFEELLKVALVLFLLGIFFEYFKYIRIP